MLTQIAIRNLVIVREAGGVVNEAFGRGALKTRAPILASAPNIAPALKAITRRTLAIDFCDDDR